MTTEQIIEEIKAINELDFASVVEAIFDRAILENMSHILIKEIEDRDFRNDEIESLHDELIHAGFKEGKMNMEIEALRQQLEKLTSQF